MIISLEGVKSPNNDINKRQDGRERRRPSEGQDERGPRRENPPPPTP